MALLSCLGDAEPRNGGDQSALHGIHEKRRFRGEPLGEKAAGKRANAHGE